MTTDPFVNVEAVSVEKKSESDAIVDAEKKEVVILEPKPVETSIVLPWIEKAEATLPRTVDAVTDDITALPP